MRFNPLKFPGRGKRFVFKHKMWSASILFGLVILFFMFKPKTPPAIPTQKITYEDIKQTVAATGTVAATHSANLTFQVPGSTVVYVAAQKGDWVKKHQVIAQLDQRTVQQNIQNAVDALNSQQISYDVVNDFNGDRTLADTGLSIDARRQLETALNSLDQNQVAVTIQQLALEQSYIFSPMDGILTRADIQTPGVVASATTTYSVIDPKSVVFDMDVDEADVANLQVGQHIDVTLDAYPDAPISLEVSKIDFVSHSTSTGGTAYTVEAVLPSNDNYKYRVGMNGNGDVLIQEKQHVVAVPLVAIFNDNHVFVKTTNGYLNRKVTLGLQSDTDAQVTDGLQVGDIVALQPDLVTKYTLDRKN